MSSGSSRQASALFALLFLAGPVAAQVAQDATSDKSVLTKQNAAVQSLYQGSGMADRVREASRA